CTSFSYVLLKVKQTPHGYKQNRQHLWRFLHNAIFFAGFLTGDAKEIRGKALGNPFDFFTPWLVNKFCMSSVLVTT
ncbi:MAG: hypothetical protein MZW92_32775, partial [Comamonadaceae bacterium]|nr:hypothetical protein [Comamonadaceae bacterium]